MDNFEYDDDDENILQEIDKIITKAEFIFKEDTDIFIIDKKKSVITIKELISLKNKIFIQNDEDKIKYHETDNIMGIKLKKLIFFNNLVSELEGIHDVITLLRKKGSSLPILISIKIEYPVLQYYLENKKTDFDRVNKYLSSVKKSLLNQLDRLYKEKEHLRFLYGILFKRIRSRFNGDISKKMDDIIRYILNKTDNNDNIKDGSLMYTLTTSDYVNHFEIYINNSYHNFSNYINSIFKNNDSNLYSHYEKMVIMENFKYQGIYLQKCNNISMEEYIIYLFWEKIKELPIAQNILICSKDTSFEEIQSFLYRAILCNYNTLFIIELTESFSECQYTELVSLVDSLLSYKYEKNINEMNMQKYLNSCIVFIYNDKINNNLEKLKKYSKVDDNNTNRDNNIGYINKDYNDNQNLLNSSIGRIKKLLINKFKIKVISSEICGLGKSHLIKKMINDEHKKYYYFPLGGKLTKNIIFEKIENIIDKIEKGNETYGFIAIHLDLMETSEIDLINEFLLSFLFTRFYIDNGNIIYIPKDIDIYIEIPNCFENYLSKHNILNLFDKKNITFENMPKFDYPVEIIKKFEQILNIDTNEKLEKFIKKYIGIEKYSFYQINIFINIFLSQYSKISTKSKIIVGEKDVIEENIEEFAKSIQYYFINNTYDKLLTGEIKTNNLDYIELMSEIYTNENKSTNYSYPLIFITEEKMVFRKIYIQDIDSKRYKNSKDYLLLIKQILNLPNDVNRDHETFNSLSSIIEKDDFIINNDNFKKMIFYIIEYKQIYQ